MSEPDPRDVTLATIREHVKFALAYSPPRDEMNERMRGYDKAMRHIQAILDVHGQPPGTPVHFR